MQTDKRPVAYLTVTECISIGHRLYSSKLSDDQNRKLFGVCNSPNGHGHDCKLEITIKGTVDEATGMIVDFCALKKQFGPVLEELDHKYLNMDVEYFKDNVTTMENIDVYLWDKLSKIVSGMSDAAALTEIKISHLDSYISYKGEIAA